MEIKDYDLGFTPSIYQEKIFDFILHGNGNAVISAKAGSGKTSTCVSAIKLIKPKNKIMFLAFNKSIAEELTEKLKGYNNVDVRTSHSLGYAIIRDNVEGEIELDEYKYRTYLKTHIDELTTISDRKFTHSQLSEYIESISSLINFSRFNLAQTPDEVRQISVKYDIPVNHDECDVVIKMLEWGKTELSKIDYTDMVWLPVELSLNAKKFQKDFIFIDECQDQSLMSIQLFLKCFKRGTRFIAVGDEKQCQPEGTKILLSDGSEKNIENLIIGDEVVSYNVEDEHMCNDEVTAIESHFANNIIRIKTQNGLESEYTPEHICYSRFNVDKCVGKSALYIMANEQNDYYIGVTCLCDEKGGIEFSLYKHMVDEKCNRIWVLNIYDDLFDTLCDEVRYSMKYKMPQLLMRNDDKDDDGLDSIFFQERLGDLTERVTKLLNEFHRDINYPFQEINNKTCFTSNYHLSEIRACNLIPKYMDVGIFNVEDTHNKSECNLEYDIIEDIEYDNSKMVYSINVSGNHNYVADNILTHNCINAFAGSSDEAFQFMLDYPKTTLFDLPICYRCPKKIVELAQTLVPEIQYNESADDGEIINVCRTHILKSGDMVLCRSKAPLLNVYNKLLRRGVQCYVKGREIGTNLKKMLDDIDIEVLNANLKEDGVFVRLYDKLFETRNKLMETIGLDYQDATLSAYITEKYDMICALNILAERYTTKTELLNHIDNIFDDNRDGVILSTIHKAKGLEADNVYILCNSSMPSSLAKKDWEKKSEQNLIYVAYTRAKKKLGFISEEEVRPFGISKGVDKVLDELGLVENLVCRVLGKTPIEHKESVDVARFNLSQGITDIKDEHENDNRKIIENLPNDDKNDDLLSELEDLLGVL